MTRIAAAVLVLTLTAGSAGVAHASIRPVHPLSIVTSVAAPTSPETSWHGADLALAVGLASAAAGVTAIFTRNRVATVR